MSEIFGIENKNCNFNKLGIIKHLGEMFHRSLLYGMRLLGLM